MFSVRLSLQFYMLYIRKNIVEILFQTRIFIIQIYKRLE